MNLVSLPRLALLLALLWQFQWGIASDLVEVLPLHQNLLMVHFDDGYVRHHLLGERRDNEWVVATPLDVALAGQASTYLLSSNDDMQYQNGLSPLIVYRKSKATDFTWLCQGWNGNCVNTDPDHAKEHWLYLELPFGLTAGNTYQLSFPGLTGINSISFTYNDLAQRSEAVHVNQLGYDPDAGEKFGYVYHWAGDAGAVDFGAYDGNSFYLIDTLNGNFAYSGNLAFRKAADNQETGQIGMVPPFGNHLAAAVYECDFSAFSGTGSFRLCVEGVGCSFPFDINNGVYQEPLQAVMNGLYQQRSGIATTAAYTDQPRPAPHHPSLTPGFGGKLVYSTFRYPDFNESDSNPADKAAIDAAVLGPLNVWGWYQDAGDWDGYYSHTQVPLHLLWLYEMGASEFGDGQFLLPEESNGFPDLLDEASWLPRFLYRLRQELMTQNYGTGGVGGGRVFGDLWGEAFLPDESTIASWQDTARTWVVTGEDPFMSYKYAGLAAHLALLLSENALTDPDGIDWAQEANEAYTWAASNTQPQDSFQFSLPMEHVRLYAAANLFRLTGDNSYQSQFSNDLAQVPMDVIFDEEILFGLATYLAAEQQQSLDPTTKATVESRFEAHADYIMLDFRDDRACRWGGNWFLPFMIGQSTTPLVQAGILGHYLFKDAKPQKAQQYRDGIHSTADYFLGQPPLNMCWITRLG
ncbi:MAG: glycoside hydrolase family 9 protein, partial [Bacteroidota bacterium]